MKIINMQCFFWNLHNIKLRSQLDPQLGAKKGLLRAKTAQLGPNLDPKPTNLEPKWRPRLPTWSQDALQRVRPLSRVIQPRWPQRLTTWSQSGSRPPNVESRWLPRPPSDSQNDPEDPQLGAKMTPKTFNRKPEMTPKTHNLEPK